MTNFKFNFSGFRKPKIKKTSYDKNRKLITKNAIGVIGITIDANYFVQIGDNKYDLTLESYDLKNKNIYYCKYLQDRKILNIISLSKQKTNQPQYLPFGVGCIVKGNIYNIFNKERFNINKIIELSDISSDEYEYYKNLIHKEKEFFRNNYNEIIKCMN